MRVEAFVLYEKRHCQPSANVELEEAGSDRLRVKSAAQVRD